MSGMNWGAASKRDLVRDRGADPIHEPPALRKSKRAGITNAQAKYLAALQRKLKTPYTGSGMSKAEAHAAIGDCVAKLERKQARAAASKPRAKRQPRTRRARSAAAGGPPTLEQVRSIEAMAERVGVDARVPDTEAEARFVLDDLRHRERASKRAA